jgi:hypothetical protein
MARPQCDTPLVVDFVGLAYQGKGIVVFRFIIEYSSSRDFGPY